MGATLLWIGLVEGVDYSCIERVLEEINHRSERTAEKSSKRIIRGLALSRWADDQCLSLSFHRCKTSFHKRAGNEQMGG